MANIIDLLKVAGKEGAQITSLVKNEVKVNAKQISKEVSENIAKRGAEAEGRKLTASTITDAQREVLKPRTVEQLRKEAADEAFIDTQRKSLQERVAQAKERNAARAANQQNKAKPKLKTLEEAIKDGESFDLSNSIANSYDDAESVAKIESNVNAKAQAEAQEKESERLSNILSSGTEPESISIAYESNNVGTTKLRNNQPSEAISPFEAEMQATEAALETKGKMSSVEVAQDRALRIDKERGKTYGLNKPITAEQAKMLNNPEYYYDSPEYKQIFNEQEATPWSSTAKAALGTAVGGAALMAALSGSRGQQNNAQLYGQQPLY